MQHSEQPLDLFKRCAPVGAAPSKDVTCDAAKSRLPCTKGERESVSDNFSIDIEPMCTRYDGGDLICEVKRPESCRLSTFLSTASTCISGDLEVSNAQALSEQHMQNSNNMKTNFGSVL